MRFVVPHRFIGVSDLRQCVTFASIAEPCRFCDPLDRLGRDTRPPAGVMALWPWSHAHFDSSIDLFPAVSRRYWLAEFWLYNVKALVVELCILGPLALFAVWWTTRRRADETLAE